VCKSKPVVIILFSLCLVSISNATNVIYVDANGPNDPGRGTFDDPFRRIQDAINAVIDGDTVEIRPGTYTGEGNYDLDPNGKSLTLKSVNPEESNIVSNTIINPNGAGRGFYFHSGNDANCVVSGLTITNANTGGKGGAIYCDYNNINITNCIIRNNSAGVHGGGVFCHDSNLTMVDCVISGNSATLDGGGLECWFGRSFIKNCFISNNHTLWADSKGGGLDCFNAGNSALTNCTFVNNSAGSGGAVYCWGGSIAMNNNILWANGANEGPQIALKPYLDTSSSVLVSYSNVQGREAMIYDPCSGLVWDDTNIDTDPCFASFDPNGDPNMWDFHLQSAYGRWDPSSQSWVSDSNTSRCIDAGDPNSDWSSELWPNGRRINMGAYGGTGQASMNGNPADFDIDGSVNFVDFAEFSNKWSAKVPCIEDLTNNGVVDFADLRMFADNWLWQRQ